MTLPFRETFATATLDPAWTVHLAKGNELQVADGVVKIEARLGSHAHFERKLGKDLVALPAPYNPRARTPQRRSSSIGMPPTTSRSA